jgi:hypothetical protein
MKKNTDKNLTAPNISSDFKLEVTTPLTTDEIRMVELAENCVKQHLNLGLSYIDLCRHIRTAQIPPVRTRELLNQMQFVQPRISEIIKVANAPEDTWLKIDAARLGFKAAIEMSRESATLKLLQSMSPDDGNMLAEELATEHTSAIADEEAQGEKQPLSTKKKIKLLCDKIANLMSKAQMTSHKATCKLESLEKFTCVFSLTQYKTEAKSDEKK